MLSYLKHTVKIDPTGSMAICRCGSEYRETRLTPEQPSSSPGHNCRLKRNPVCSNWLSDFRMCHETPKLDERILTTIQCWRTNRSNVK